MFRPKREEVVEDWRRLHDEEMHYLYASPNIIIRKNKSRRMTWVGHIARIEEMRKIHAKF
jgi:hypothetical protein